jgi:ribosome-associated translation inhibitor RaiA
MTGLPSHCPKCGLIFESNVFGELSNASNITFKNIGTSCPRCGGIAQAIDGTFDFVGNAIKVKSAPPRTLAILSVLQKALEEAQQGKPEGEVLSKIEQASPELASAIQATIAKSGKPILVVLLLSLLATCSTNTTLNWNQLVDQVHVYATGSDPYPTGSIQAEPEAKPKISRQQRRYKERQTKKRQRQTEPRKPAKPSH